VSAALNASVHDHIDPVTNSIDDFSELVEVCRKWPPVEEAWLSGQLSSRGCIAVLQMALLARNSRSPAPKPESRRGPLVVMGDMVREVAIKHIANGWLRAPNGSSLNRISTLGDRGQGSMGHLPGLVRC
jgi:hypothetical protein